MAKKIYLIGLNPVVLSGQTTSLLSLGLELEEKGHTVTISTPFYFGPPDGMIQLRKEKNAGIQLKSWSTLIRRIFKYKQDYDLFQIHLPIATFTLFADLLFLFVNRPYYVYFEACSIKFSSRFLREILRYPRYYLKRAILNHPLWSRLSFKTAKRYIVAGNYLKEQLVKSKFPPEKIYIIENKVHRKILSTPIYKKDNKLNKKVNGPILGHLGHVLPNKGIHILIETFYKILRTYPDAHLLLALSATSVESYKNECFGLIKRYGLEEHISIVGKVSLKEFYETIDLFVVPYLFNFASMYFPSVLWEATYYGCPILSSDIEIMKEWAHQNPNTYLASINGPSHMESVCLSLLSSLKKEGKKHDPIKNLIKSRVEIY